MTVKFDDDIWYPGTVTDAEAGQVRISYDEKNGFSQGAMWHRYQPDTHTSKLDGKYPFTFLPNATDRTSNNEAARILPEPRVKQEVTVEAVKPSEQKGHRTSSCHLVPDGMDNKTTATSPVMVAEQQQQYREHSLHKVQYSRRTMYTPTQAEVNKCHAAARSNVLHPFVLFSIT